MNPKVKICTLLALALSLLFCGFAWSDETDLVWSTFLGGTGFDAGLAIAVDSAGNTYVTGLTDSEDFPTSAGAFDDTFHGLKDAFVAKLNPTGSTLLYSTFLGGSEVDQGLGIAVDGAGNAYVTGPTGSEDFPTTAGAFDITYNMSDAFVAKLNPTGSSLIYSTFLGGRHGLDFGNSIAVDGTGNAYVTGPTGSDDFPTTAGAFDTSFNSGIPFWGNDAFVAKLNPTGSSLVYSTFLGGSYSDEGNAIALDGSGNAYVTGQTESDDFPSTPSAFDITLNGNIDAFVAKLNPTGSALCYSTFLGGNSSDNGSSIAVDGAGNAYVTGMTCGGVPTTPGAFDTTPNGDEDVFVTKLNSTGSALVYSTFIGGTHYDCGYGIAMDEAGNAYVTGEVVSTDFPTTAGALDTTCDGYRDAFVVKLNSAGNTLDYSTFLGGTNEEQGGAIALDNSGNPHVTGYTMSNDFPTTAGSFDETFNGGYEVFMAELSLVGTPVGSETPIIGPPRTFVLHQNYPNPFNASTEIRYQIPEDGHVTLKIFNTLGQEVRILVDAEQKANFYTVRWETENLASGLYFCRLKVGDFEKTIKMVLLK